MRILLFFLFLYGEALAKEAPLTVLVSHFPPFLNEKEPSQGFSWKLLHDFASSKGIKIKAQFLPTARLLTQIEKGDWQATLTRVPKDINGQIEVLYADKKVSYGLLVKHHDTVSLDGLHVAAIRATEVVTVRTPLKQQGVKFTEVNTLAQAYRMYEVGRVDAVLGVMMDGKALGAKNTEEFVMIKKLLEIPFTLSLNTNNTNAMSAYNKLTEPSKN